MSDDQNIAPAIHERKGHLTGWRDIGTAPFDTPVEIKAGSMTFLARLWPDASEDENEQSCDQWIAHIEGEHPPCWSAGACWSSNENDDRSLQPEAWRHIGAASAAPELLEALKACLAFLTTAPLESGYCCCGDTVDGHNLGSGHAPVDDLAYYAGQVAEKIRAAITKAEG